MAGRRDCMKGCDPQVDNSSIHCDGNFVGQECVILNANPYLEINAGEGLGALIKSISRRLKSIVQTLRNKIDYKYLYEEDMIFVDDIEAGNAGVAVGSPYIDTNGFVRIRLN